MYEKDFDKWNEVKKKVNDRKQSIPFNECEIWWTSIGVNIGFELDGTGSDYERPAVIIKNINNVTCYIVPLTTSENENNYRLRLGKIGGRKSWAAISQFRMIDVRRLRNRMGKIDKNMLERIRKAVKENL